MSSYPGAANAVELCEKLQQSAMRAMALAEEIGNEGKKQVLKEALSQWDHPDFLLYLGAKFGSI